MWGKTKKRGVFFTPPGGCTPPLSPLLYPQRGVNGYPGIPPLLKYGGLPGRPPCVNLPTRLTPMVKKGPQEKGNRIALLREIVDPLKRRNRPKRGDQKRNSKEKIQLGVPKKELVQNQRITCWFPKR